jgi:hypothetical protein
VKGKTAFFATLAPSIILGAHSLHGIQALAGNEWNPKRHQPLNFSQTVESQYKERAPEGAL